MQGFSLGIRFGRIHFYSDVKLKLMCIQARESLSNEAQAESEVVSEATLKIIGSSGRGQP